MTRQVTRRTPADQTKGLQLDAEGYLSRPVSPKTLKSEVSRIIDTTSVRILKWAESLKETERKMTGAASRSV